MRWILSGARTRPGTAVIGAILMTALSGCTQLRYENEAAFIERGIRARNEKIESVMFKASILVPGRDILTLDPLWRLVFGDEAWNGVDGGVQDSSFQTNRSEADLAPERVALGACVMPPPEPPFVIKKVNICGGGALGFIGTDALDRKFLVKLDDPDYPELGSTSAIVGSRVLWALGYNVAPIYLVNIDGTGNERLDGKRGAAALFIDNARGHFHFDWFRHRREVRGLRLASAWLNDTDRIGSNTLVVERDGRATYYLIDFNSCLGSWQGRPKDAWRGHRYAWDILLPSPPPTPVVSPAIGRFDAEFDPMRWRAQAPNNAFNHMTDADAAWMVERIRRIGEPQLRAIVAEARLTDPSDAQALLEIMLKRRTAILNLQ